MGRFVLASGLTLADQQRDYLRLSAVGDLEAHSRLENEFSPISQVRLQLTLNAPQHMTLLPPVVRNIARGVLDHPDPDAREFACSPVRETNLARVLGRCDGRPVGSSEWDAFHLHVSSSPK